MTVEELLSQLRNLDVKIWVEGDRLRVSAPPGVLSSQLQNELTQRKGELVEFLRAIGSGASAALPLHQISREGDLILSFAQQRLWFLDRLDPRSPVYNISTSFKFESPVDLDALEKSVNEIVRRHESLRTVFGAKEGQPFQRILPPQPFALPVHDLSHLPESERLIQAEEFCRVQARQPFDLERGPLFQANLLQLGAQSYMMLLTMHHIVSDGWSLGVLARELRALYWAFSTGNPSPLPELAIQYADFAYWQRQWLQGETLQQQLNFWTRFLSGSPSLLELPTDRPRPTVQSNRGSTQSLTLPLPLAEKIRALCRQEKVTLFMLLLAVFKVLLYRYTGASDILVGTPVANRTRVETEPMIGFFVNTLVLRTDLSGNPAFRDLLQRVRQVALDSYAHQDLPFELLVEKLNPKRQTSYSPLFQVMFVLDNAVFPLSDIDNGTSKYDLTLFIRERENQLKGLVEFSTDLFERDTIVRMIGHLQTLLEAVVDNPNQKIDELALLTGTEYQRLVYERNATCREYPQDKCVHQLFEEQVARTPDAIAVVGESIVSGREEQLTYRELNCRANQLAHHLKKLGVGPQVCVGISIHRTIEMLVGVLGILKAGGAYLPLDPAFPQDRLKFMAQDAQIPALLTQQSLVAELPEHSARVVRLDTDWQAIARESFENPDNDVATNDLAYVLYTSGSTGKPKGVQVSHRSLTNLLVSMQREPGLIDSDVLLSVTTLSFDISGLELYLPIVTGARVVIAPREVAADGVQLAHAITRHGTTVMQATPATWRMLLESGWAGKPNFKILCGGETLPRDLADALLDRCGSLWNMYGPTETTIWSTLERVERNKPITIGCPIANTTGYILDANMQPVPMGVPGNLYIGGDGLARGYLNRPELTAERFVRDPFHNDPNARLYLTGDVARYLANGSIDYLGRSDNQVKIRGFRVELGEIEVALTQHTDVAQAVVIAHEFQPGDKRLVAYFVPHLNASPSANELRDFLKAHVPDYMLPSAFVLLTNLPLTPNGKIDRKALPKPDGASSSPEREFVAPRTPTEQALVTIWVQVLKVSPISVHDNFFDLGGHSLLATQVVSRIRHALRHEVLLRSLFEHPTIAELAEYVDALALALHKLRSSAETDLEREDVVV